MQTLFKSNLFSGGNKTLTGAKNFVSGGKKLGASIVGTARNNIVSFSRAAKTLIPQKKDDDKKNSFIGNYTDFFGSKKTERILRKNLKLVRDSLVSTFEIARHLKAAIIGITDNLKTKVKGGGGGLFGGLGKLFSGLSGLLGIVPTLLSIAALVTNPVVLGILTLLAAGGIVKLLSDPNIRNAVFGFLERHAKPIVGFLWDSIRSLVGGLIEKIVPKWMRNPWDWGKDVVRGGEGFNEKTKELNQRLKDAGMDKEGNNMSIQGAKRRNMRDLPNEGRTEEQQKIFEEVEAERSKLKETQNTMSEDMKDTDKKIVADRKIGAQQLKKEILSLPFGSKKRVAKEKELRLYDAETRKLRKEAKKEIKSDANRSVKEGIEPDKDESKLKPEGSDKRLVTKKDDAPKIDAPLSDIAKLDLYPEPENLGPRVNLTPITFDQGSKTADTQQSQQPMSTGGGANSPSGNAVTFYSSTNSDDSYTALNAKMTFNIV